MPEDTVDTEFGNYDAAANFGLPDSNVTLGEMAYGPAYGTAATTMGNNTVSGSTTPTASWLESTQSTVNYGLKVADQLIGSYGKVLGLQGNIQDQQLNRYLKSSSMDLARIQVGGQMDVAKLRAETNSNIARMYANSAGTGANLANVGQTPSSLMLYLTIAGVLFTFIQVLKS